MENEVQLSPITIYSKGDPSVGIFSTYWTINEEIYIDKEDIELFREKLSEAFEHVADDCKIIFNYEKLYF